MRTQARVLVRLGLGLGLGLLVGGAGGCDSKKRQQRAGDAAPVELITTPTLPSGSASGATTDEVEPNDSADVATPLELGGTARGKTDGSDADYFGIEITEAGTLAVTTTAVDADLTLEIEDATGTVLARSDRGTVRTREGVPNLGVTPGRYTAIVKRKLPAPPKRKGKGKKPAPAKPVAAVSYEITAQLVPTLANAEREPDDDRGTANELIIGDAATGFVGWTGDLDVWKLSVETLSAKNAIDIEVGAVEGVALALELSDGIGQPLLARKAPKGAPLVVRGVVPVVPSGGAPFYYVAIKGVGSNPETPYQLRISARAIEPDAELEPNDVPEKAMAFPPDRTRVDGNWTAGDVDCFAFGADVTPRTLELTVTPTDVDVAIELHVDGASVAKADAAGKGAAEKLSGTVPASAKAVLCVRGGGKDPAGEGRYEVTLREGPASEQ